MAARPHQPHYVGAARRYRDRVEDQDRMMRKALLSVAALSIAAGNVLARDAAMPPAFRAADYPIEIRKALSYGPEECKRQGGGRVTFAPDTVRRVDINGDGRDDYVVSFEDTECPGQPSTFCGTSGCTVEFFVTLSNGKLRNVFSDRIRGYQLLGSSGVVRFELHGAYCAGAGNPSCVREQRIADQPFVFREPRD